jgi:hypothetical protein
MFLIRKFVCKPPDVAGLLAWGDAFAGLLPFALLLAVVAVRYAPDGRAEG